MTFRFVDYPGALLLLSVTLLSAAAYLGGAFRRGRELNEDQKNELSLVAGGVLTLLGLIIGFSFSMAVARYDARKADEATEANSIGTEFLRAGLLDSADRENVRNSLKNFLSQRIAWYEEKSPERADAIAQQQAATERTMWWTVQRAATERPTPVRSLVASGMNEVIDDAGYTLAAWENRIPRTAWLLMFLIALCAFALLGYNVRKTQTRFRGIYLLTIVVSVAFFLIADLDSTRGGLITIAPGELVALEATLW